MGTNQSGSTATVGMTWRTRATDEIPGTAKSPPMGNRAGFLVSDVVQLSGMGLSGTNGATDTYVMEMSFDPTQFKASSVLNNFQNGNLFLGTYTPGPSTMWQNAIATNVGAAGQYAETNWYNPSAGIGANESFATFWANAQAAGATTLNSVLGAWGVDTTNDVAWAVVNHDSDFAVVPEPVRLGPAGGRRRGPGPAAGHPPTTEGREKSLANHRVRPPA